MALQRYRPRSAPSATTPEARELARWLEHELSAIAMAMAEFSHIKLVELATAPERPRDGMIVYADGANWNPGAGEGPYAYIAGAWTKLFP